MMRGPADPRGPAPDFGRVSGDDAQTFIAIIQVLHSEPTAPAFSRLLKKRLESDDYVLLAHLFEEISVLALHHLIPEALLFDAFAFDLYWDELREDVMKLRTGTGNEKFCENFELAAERARDAEVGDDDAGAELERRRHHHAAAAPPAESAAKTVGRGVMFIGFAKIYFMLTGTVQRLLLTRIVSPADMGDFAVVNSLINIPNNTVVQGTIQSVSKPTAEDDARAGAVQRAGLRLGAVLGTLIAVGLAVFGLRSAPAAAQEEPAFGGLDGEPDFARGGLGLGQVAAEAGRGAVAIDAEHRGDLSGRDSARADAEKPTAAPFSRGLGLDGGRNPL